ncbi:MAG: sugar ABC transporter substrate-binding protein [Desulfobacterales bacterium]|nr:sugar ABC transporter substrate-binding protein [Desulfobacterales bacterium]
MKVKKIVLKTMVMALVFVFTSSVITAAEIDWKKLRTLEGEAFLKYFESLGLKGQAALDFWKKVPVSKANKQVYKIYKKEAFAIYMNKYPRAGKKGTDFKAGMGTEIMGPMSRQKLKLPFTSYHPLKEGPIGNPDKTYKIGYTIHGFSHPWLLNNADSAMWEANRHPNVKLTVLDPEFDNAKQVQHVDNWIAQGFDGIMIWPMQEAPTGPPIIRALGKGIPCVSIDRMTGANKITARVTGNFPANGAQQGIYLVHRLLKEKGKVEGTVLMIRKPLGSTADSMRTGHFLKVVSYFPGLKIVGSFHNSSNRKDSFEQVGEALKAHKNLDIIFCTGAEQSMGAVQAVDMAKRWNSRDNGRRIIVLNNDDLYEAMMAVQEEKLAMTAPYTPLLGALGMRILLKISDGEKLPRDITTPDLPMITKEKEIVMGVETITVKDWMPYAYGSAETESAETD